jgi:DnaK suppressor protein
VLSTSSVQPAVTGDGVSGYSGIDIPTVPVDENERRQLILRLQRQRFKVATDIAAIRHAAGEQSTQPDGGDAAPFPCTSEMDIEMAIAEIAAESVRGIDAALKRLEDGSYGYCAECGGEIGTRRLEAMPFASRCRDCQEHFELARPRSTTTRGWMLE